MKNVVYDYQIFLQQRYGGISRYFYELAQRVEKTPGFSASVFAPLHANDYLSMGKVKSLGLRVRKLPKIWRLYEAFDVATTKGYLAVSKPAIVHETYYHRRKLAPKSSLTVVTVFDMIHERLRHMFDPRDNTTAVKKQAVERADRIICISEHTRRDLIELFDVPEDKAVTIHLGFGLESPPNLRTTLERPCAGPYLLYVGARHIYKNFHGFLRAFGASPVLQNNFSIIAFGGSPLSATDYKVIDQFNISRAAIKWYQGNDGLLADLYRGAAAFIYPSFYEGFGIPPLEAMSCDCPVICSNASSIPEVVGEAAMLFDPSDADAMRRAMESVVTSEATRALLVAAGRRRIEHFSWDRCAAETVSVYSHLLN